MIHVETFPVNPLSENTYVVSDDTHEAVIIDCGAFTVKEQAAVADYISENQLHPVAHLLTHAHFDHCFGAVFVFERYGLAPRCHTADRPFLDDLPGQMRQILGHALRCPQPTAGEDLTAQSVITFGTHRLTVIEMPGHSPGGICLYCPEEDVLFSGDSLFQMSIGRTDFPGGDHWTLIRGLQQLLRTLPPQTRIYPGHGPATTAADERQGNPFLGNE